ncbi:NAD-dependent epimerase/dehydratase family protein [Ulvibacterium sp.]|uniref:NAD-dependent epimerase/dehydratase family protein n=1 Tax=Ulvibacterium sp. TaxID=2665914 RepID=UPI003BAAA7E8
MHTSRRKFLKDFSIAGAATFSMPFILPNSISRVKLNVLVLGGTNFLGPAIVQSLVTKGHRVTLFNRGITNPNMFPKLSKIKGDREKGLTGYRNLAKGKEIWDVVIDVWPQDPNFVQNAITILQGRAKYYVFVSSIAVYSSYEAIRLDENTARRKGDAYEEGNYNLNKALCEKAVEEAFPDRFIIVRPGAIVGDRDSGPFGRYLLNRIKNRKEILAPDSNDPVQFIDAQDIGNFIAQCIEKKVGGHFNLVGPASTMGYKDLLIQAKKTLKSEVGILWMDPKFLVEEVKLEPFMEIPFWIPVALDPEPGFYQISNKRAIDHGLVFTDYNETVKTSYLSFKEKRFIEEEGYDVVFGISEEREDAIIARWKQKNN